MGADQPLNAARCQALGVARALDAVTATPTLVREAASLVLRDPTYRRSAERIRDEIAQLPGPEHVTLLLERLTAGGCARGTNPDGGVCVGNGSTAEMGRLDSARMSQ